jgi:hypothetical protein
VERSIDADIWLELLSKPGRLHLIPRVRKELEAHFKAAISHPLKVAFDDNDASIVEIEEPSEGAAELRALVYYVQLLAARRLVLGKRLRRSGRLAPTTARHPGSSSAGQR